MIDSTMAIETVVILVCASAVLAGVGFFLKASYRDAEQLGKTISRKGASRRRSTL